MPLNWKNMWDGMSSIKWLHWDADLSQCKVVLGLSSLGPNLFRTELFYGIYSTLWAGLKTNINYMYEKPNLDSFSEFQMHGVEW